MATYLTRTNSSSSNTYTFSAWLKHSTVGVNDYKTICLFGTDRDVSTTMSFSINNSDKWNVYNGSSHNPSDQVARDCNAWYHVVLKVDNLVGTIYVNNEIAKSSITCKATGTETNKMIVGGYVQPGNEDYFNGVMAHVHFIDGTAYDADTFGETDATTGIWKPKLAPSVTYGTNGFFLKFENSGAFGTDSSGNGNTFTVNGTMTQTIDTPSNVFATWNPLNEISSVSYTNGNTTFTNSSSSNRLAFSNYAFTKGKYYCEMKVVEHNSNYTHIGLNNIGSYRLTNAYVNDPTNEKVSYLNDGRVFIHGGTLDSTGITYTTGDIIGMACDMDNGYLYYHKNGTYLNSGDPTSGGSGTGGFDIYNHGNVDYCFAVSNSDGGTDPVISANFGNGYFGTTAVSSAQNPDDGIGIFEYDVPAGYRALCTKSINAQEYS